MERLPAGITEEQYAIWREEVVRQLSPAELAVFMLVENLWNLEQRRPAPRQPRHEIGWGRGTTTEMILDDILNGDVDSLPFPRGGGPGDGYRTFDWYLIEPGTRSRIWRDMRIRVGSGSVTLNANLGELQLVEAEVAGLIGQIPYPMMAWDNHGFRFENAAMRAAPPR